MVAYRQLRYRLLDLVLLTLANSLAHSIGQIPAAMGAAPASPICPTQLESQISAIATRPELQRSRWGIFVQTQASPNQRATLYAQDAEHYFIPASNVKLLTTAAALTRLGPDFQIRTSIYDVSASSDASPPTTELHLVGRGDPSLTTDQLQQLAQQLRDRGITQVDRLVADDRYFQGDAVHPNWEWEDIQAGYGAPVNSLILNQNAIGLTLVPQTPGEPLRVEWDDPADASIWQIENASLTVEPGSPEELQVGRDLSRPILRLQGQLQSGSPPEEVAIAIPNPAEHFLQRFQAVLTAEGIAVLQTQPASEVLPEGAVEVATVLSPPLHDLLIETNQDSNNLYAESLLRLLGTTDEPGLEDASTLGRGITAIESELTQLGVNPAGYELADGSGLSRHNLVSPAALVETLQAMAQSPHAAVYRNSLAIAGNSGTLRNRFQDTPVAGNLWGKTGALSGVASLSGYLDPPNYPPLVFSILVNHFEQPVRSIRPLIDEIVLLLSRLQRC